MGDRATVSIWNYAASPEEAPVVLYTHWGASTVMQDVMSAIERRERWSDPSYLSRIIFCHMLCGDNNPLSGSTGYGIMTDNISDARVEIIIDCDRQEIMVKELDRDDETYTFEEFAELGKDLMEVKNDKKSNENMERVL